MLRAVPLLKDLAMALRQSGMTIGWLGGCAALASAGGRKDWRILPASSATALTPRHCQSILRPPNARTSYVSSIPYHGIPVDVQSSRASPRSGPDFPAKSAVVLQLCRATSATPTRGQHNDSVFHAVLGLDAAERAQLEAAGVLREGVAPACGRGKHLRSMHQAYQRSHHMAYANILYE
jgi:hypothetical protein